jgi:hypothetical protein
MAKAKSKTEKKLDNNLRLALTDVCELSLKDIAGFQWLTHQANYTNFPASLFITCVFDHQSSLEQADANGDMLQIRNRIQARLLKIGVKFKALNQQVAFDSEEACEQSNNGDWDQRLAASAARVVAKNRP